MNFRINPKTFLGLLRTANAVVTANPTDRINETVMIHLADNQMKLRTTGVHCSLVYTLPFESDKDGTACVDIKALINYISLLKAGHPEIMCYTSGKTFFVVHQNGEMEFPTMPPEEFSKEEVLYDAKINEYEKDQLFPKLKHVMETTVTSNEFSAMANLCFRGFDLAGYEGQAFQKYVLDRSFDTDVLVPRKVMSQILSVFAEVDEKLIRIGHTARSVVFSAGGVTVVGKLFDLGGTYLQYESVIPEFKPETIQVNKTELIAGLRRASLACVDTDSKIIELQVEDGDLYVMASTAAYETKAKEKINCDTAFEDGWRVLVAVDHFIKQLNYAPEDLELLISMDGRMLGIKKEDSLCLIVTRAA